MPHVLDHLMESREFNEFLFQNLSAAVFILDKDLRVQKVNTSYRTLFRKDEDVVINQLCGNSIGCAFAVEEGKPCGSTSQCSVCTLRQCLVNGIPAKGGTSYSTYISRNFYIDGSSVSKHFKVTTKWIVYHDADLAIVSIDDVTELEEQKQKIRELADRDSLTGLYNRRSLFDYGVKVFENALRGNRYLAVAMIDMDLFKNINDSYGHEAGDLALTALADVFRSQMREGDLVARYGGDEFCILFSVKRTSDAYLVMDKIRSAVGEKGFYYQNSRVAATVSCGVTFSLEESLDAMIRTADRMLYLAKEKGRDRVVVFEA
jgi:diguanylate cyclase (GGDEF)-like protein